MINAPPPIRRGVRGIFYGWWVVAGAFAIQALSSALLFNAFGAYFVHLQAEFGWSRAALAGAFSLSRVESGMLGPIQGWLVDRFGTRAILRVGIVVFALGFFAFSRIESLFAFYGAYLVLSLGASLGGFLTVNAALANWFDRRRATAMGLASTGWGIAGIMVPIVAVALTEFGWRTTAFGSGVLVLVVGLPLAQLMRHAPEPYGLHPDGERPDESPSGIDRPVNEGSDPAPMPPPRARGHTAIQALRTSSFWFISLGHATAMLTVSMINVFLIPHLNENLGMSVERAALIVAFLTTLSVLGQATTGFLGDRFDKRLIIVTAMFVHAVALIILAFATSTAMVLVFAVLHGLAWGFRGPLMTAIRAEYFGRESFATIMGFSSLVIQIGTVTGPLLGGFIGDFNDGDYRPAFIIVAVFAVVGAFLFAAAGKPGTPQRQGGDAHADSQTPVRA